MEMEMMSKAIMEKMENYIINIKDYQGLFILGLLFMKLKLKLF